MRRAALIIVPSLAICGALAACGPSSPSAQAPQSTPGTTTTTSAPAVAAPPPPTPATTAKCPYLDPATVQDDNAQRAASVKISALGGQTQPSCFFYRSDGSWQLTVWVYSGSPAVAQAIVNQQAPIATSNPATDPAGWQGGSGPTSTGAVYAVAKGGDAVVVTTNQKQSIKARLVADHVVSSLGW
jgi:UPF0176 protein